jgi:hypothetical protein
MWEEEERANLQAFVMTEFYQMLPDLSRSYIHIFAAIFSRYNMPSAVAQK